jgi:hypothetical protein
MTAQIRLDDVLGTPPDTPSVDKVSIYINGKKMYLKDDTGTVILLGGKDPESKSIIIENPTAAEDLSFFFTDVALTFSKIVVVLVGSATPSVTWTIRHGTSRSAGGSEVVTGGTVTTDTGSGDEITVFDDATVVANSHIWIETTAKSGTVDSMIVNTFYDED